MRKRYVTSHFLLLRLAFAVSAFLVGASFFLLPAKWHKSAQFHFVNLLPIPWWVYGALLVGAAVLSLYKRTRPQGYLIGAIVYTFFALAAWLAVIGGIQDAPLWLHLPSGKAGSVFSASNFSTLSIVYWSLLHWSIIEHVDPDRRAVK